jgi:hypothetical protein
MEIATMALAGVIVFCVVIYFLLRVIKKDITEAEVILGIAYIISLLLFGFGMSLHSFTYDQAVDPVNDECYSPFSKDHLLTLIVYFILFNTSIFLIWKKGQRLPPLTLVLSMVILLAGIVLSITIFLQVTYHDIEDLTYNRSDDSWLLLFAPVMSVFIAIVLLVAMIRHRSENSFHKAYSNKFLNSLNGFLMRVNSQPYLILLILFPVVLIITIVLLLFGQDVDSLTKVFTDTTTWRFSQQMHPPALGHTGHYLCTVAACGDPKVVKPIRLGHRGGKEIIVTRQLLIANAFEEMILDFSPKMHKVIRDSYDRFGYDLSKKINTPFWANITYFFMKPLEWIFLLCLYLFCEMPEEKIKKQYC